MKKIVFILILSSITSSTFANCYSYLVAENGDGEILETFKSSRFLSSCKKAHKKCLNYLASMNLGETGNSAVCIQSRDFDWQVIQEVAHEIDKNSSKLHKLLEDEMGDHDDEMPRKIRKAIKSAHKLAEAADKLHEKVEIFKWDSFMTQEEYDNLSYEFRKLNYRFKKIQSNMKTKNIFSAIKEKFKKLEDYYAPFLIEEDDLFQ